MFGYKQLFDVTDIRVRSRIFRTLWERVCAQQLLHPPNRALFKVLDCLFTFVLILWLYCLNWLSSSESNCLWIWDQQIPPTNNANLLDDNINNSSQVSDASEYSIENERYLLTTTSEPVLLIERLPGEIFDANKQCKISFGTNYGLCRVPIYMYII